MIFFNEKFSLTGSYSTCLYIFDWYLLRLAIHIESDILKYCLTVFRYNIIFFLSGGGKFNYQGTRKFIDESLETSGDHEFEVLVSNLLPN